jgi:hypothetical protein
VAQRVNMKSRFDIRAIPRSLLLLLFALIAILLLGIYLISQKGSPDPQSEDPEIIWPALDSIQPDRAIEGELISLVGHGGYLVIKEGESTGYNESYRTFQISFDGDAIGDLGCFTNHCEGEFTVPAGVQPGPHQISVEGGSALDLVIEGD